MSTQSEIAIGKEYDKQITDQNVIVTDPLLNQWVNGISQRLWDQTARKDVPYSIKIIDSADVNAFSTLGGYIYINEGTLDFAQSDDELAGVIGHETGHIERRHAVTANNKASILNILFGIGSLFSPILYRFGQILEAGALAKVSRDDETQADKYGLMLMTRAGYDPAAMVSFMAHLGAVYRENHDFLSKYLADHPDAQNRLAHLVGYPELDPTKRTDDQRLAAAVHDLDESRYNVAAMELSDILKRRPTDATAQFDLGEAQLALGQISKGEQNLSAAAANISPQAKILADVRVKQLREDEHHFDLLHPALKPLRDQLATAEANETQAATAIMTRRQQARDQLNQLQNRVQQIVYGMPNLSNIRPRKDSRLDAVMHNITIMSKSLNTTTDKASEVIGGVGSIERGKESGMLKENQQIYSELAAPLNLAAPPPQALATFASYPKIFQSLGEGDADLVRGIDASRASLALLDIGLGDLDNFVRELQRSQLDGTGDISMMDYKRLEPYMTKAVDSLNRAAVGATQGSQLFNMARARQLQCRIDMLGLGASPDRYATFQQALNTRFHTKGLDYAHLVRDNITPGEVATAAIVGADTNASPQAVLAEAKATGKSVIDVANARGMFSQSLEIFLGLVYLDYTDDPIKEAQART
ncbi:MAG TPA: M48 family metalloprotease [Candidatus Limnocylindria bacterium]|nr:M48 family metalloprotease [Candidatus Limnocylindria bacterium]